MTTTGERLTTLRNKLGMSQQQVADTIGVDRTSYAKYEKDVNKPTRKLKELSDLFNVSTDYMMCLTDNPYRNPFEDGKTIGQLASEYEPRTPTEVELYQQAANKVIARDRAVSSTSGLSSKEERDIESDLEDMMNSMASAAYEGNTEAEEDVEALKATLKAAMIQAKKVAKKKYTPKKYRRD